MWSPWPPSAKTLRSEEARSSRASQRQEQPKGCPDSSRLQAGNPGTEPSYPSPKLSCSGTCVLETLEPNANSRTPRLSEHPLGVSFSLSLIPPHPPTYPPTHLLWLALLPEGLPTQLVSLNLLKTGVKKMKTRRTGLAVLEFFISCCHQGHSPDPGDQLLIL